ncbi:MAG: hypothetical protein Q9174_002083 [Haloplaca sp. 1 TL-2023]
MGSSSSKAARTATAAASRRKYPSRTAESNPTTNASSEPPPRAGQPEAPGPTVYPQSQASGNRDESINLDASDPDFARSLRSLGPVQPSSTLSNSSAFDPSAPQQQTPQQKVFPNPLMNPALQILSRRDEIAREAEAEFSRPRGEGEGRKFLDVIKIREVLVMRDEKMMGDEEIERRLGLTKGLVQRLGAKGVVGEAELGEEERGPI